MSEIIVTGSFFNKPLEEMSSLSEVKKPVLNLFMLVSDITERDPEESVAISGYDDDYSYEGYESYLEAKYGITDKDTVKNITDKVTNEISDAVLTADDDRVKEVSFFNNGDAYYDYRLSFDIDIDRIVQAEMKTFTKADIKADKSIQKGEERK